MATFNISFYLKNIQRGMTTLVSNQKIVEATIGKIGMVIKSYLDPGDTDIINFSSGKVSNLMNGKAELDGLIVNNLGNTDVLDLIDEIFDTTIQSDFNESLISDTCNIINECAQEEPALSPSTKANLQKLLDDENYVSFLKEAFIKSCVASNITLDELDDINGLYLTEVKMKCPICGKTLIKKTRGHEIKMYNITKIYNEDFPDDVKEQMKKPSKLEGFDNNIALCNDCSNEYTETYDIETYNNLCELKKTFQEELALLKELQKFDVEKELDKIIVDLGSMSTSTIASLDTLNAVEVKNKILPSNGTLFNGILFNVTKYYKYLRNRFSQLEADGVIKFNDIKRNVHFAYQTLQDRYDDQNKIHAELVKWLKDKLMLPDEKLGLCKIVIDFFVQNCEVFYEITE